MNWFGKQQGEGNEYHLLVVGLSLALLVTGAGKWSVDKVMVDRVRARLAVGEFYGTEHGHDTDISIGRE